MNTTRETTRTIPEGITREHVLKAIADFDRNGRPRGFGHSHTYVLNHDGRLYPPPAIFALAVKQVSGILPTSGFPVGKGSRCFAVLRACGFEITQKPKTDQSQNAG